MFHQLWPLVSCEFTTALGHVRDAAQLQKFVVRMGSRMTEELAQGTIHLLNRLQETRDLPEEEEKLMHICKIQTQFIDVFGRFDKPPVKSGTRIIRSLL